MTLYRTSRCPSCGALLENMESTGWNDFESDIGHPVEHCFRCQSPYSTGKIYWDDMSSLQRGSVYLKVLISCVYSSLAYSLGLFLLVFFIGKQMKWILENTAILKIGIIVFALVSSFVTYRIIVGLSTLKKITPETFDS